MINRIRKLISSLRMQSIPFKKEDFDITLTDINTCLNACGYYPDTFPAELLIEKLNGLNSRNEAAMFLAHVFHESEGFKYKEEINRSNNYMSSLGDKDKSYHGRGYMMITWPENYLACGKALGLGEQLIHSPEKLLTDNLAIESAIWYWKDIVRKANGVSDSNFWNTTMAINGSIEMSESGEEMANHRYDLYVRIARALGVNDYAQK